LNFKTGLCPDGKKTMDVRKLGAEGSVWSEVEKVT
jgi:hypothetical protein